MLSAGEYSGTPIHVGYDPSVPKDFSVYNAANDAVAYDIYLKSQGGYVYGFINPRPDLGGSIAAIPGQFANLYFDLDPANGNGSDLGFETSTSGTAQAFVPGVAGNVSVSGIITAFLNGYEFAIPNALFTTPIAGLNYYPGQAFPSVGDDVVLRISQSLGYSPVGGASFGTDRLGRVTLAAASLPEPASLALLGAGLAMAGVVRRARRRD